MSAAATKWAWSQTGARSTTKLVLLYLSALIPVGRNTVSPSTADIVRWTGLDKKTVPLCLKELADLGLIEIHPVAGAASEIILNVEADSDGGS